MLKKMVLPMAAFAMALALTSAPAQAAVRFGISVGPVYTYPVPAPYVAPIPVPYADPYAYGYPYPNYYAYPAPVYRYGGHERLVERGHEFRGHGEHDRGGHRR